MTALTDSKRPKVTFISRHYPPNPNINGESVWDMAKYLREKHGIESNIICIDRSFGGGGGQKREPVGNIIPVKTIYQGRNAILRFGAFIWDGYMLIRKAKGYKDTLIICTTSPPLLPFWASKLFDRKVRWALWALDLFPEGLAATGYISRSNPFYKWTKKVTYAGSPSLIIALGPMQANHLQEEYQRKIPTLILPCGVFFYQNNSETPPEWYDKDKIFLGYCGNLNDAHNPELIKSLIDRLDPEKHRLVLALYGNKAEPVKAYAKGKPGVIMVDSVPRDQLHYIDIHLVSLVKPWTHIAVPSKAVSAVCAGSSFIFCGSMRSDNWHLLQRAGWFVEENETIQEQIGDLLEKIDKQVILKRRKEANSLYHELKEQILDTYDAVAEKAKSK